MFQKLDLFPSSGIGKKTPAMLGPLGRCNSSNSECYTPLSEPFRLYLCGILPLFNMDVLSSDWQGQDTHVFMHIPEVEDLQLLLKLFQLNQNSCRSTYNINKYSWDEVQCNLLT
jgi:hypothetical protein